MAQLSGFWKRHGGHTEGTEMDMSMDMSSTSSIEPLSAEGVDFSNRTQASAFLEDLLDDTYLKIDGANHAKYFWYGIVVFIGVTMLFKLMRWLILQKRLREAARRKVDPSKPKHTPVTWFATVTAMGREMSYYQFTPFQKAGLKIPPVGTVILVLAYLAFVLALEFVDNDVEGAQYWQALGVRAGWLAVAQTPLLILLVNKNSVIGTLTGTSWERLNVLHRWSARIMLLLAVFHFAFQSTGWQEFGVMQLEWQTDDCPTTGMAALALLLWMNFSTIAPLRELSYEFFVAQHIITFFGFIVAIMLHLPSTAISSRVYIYIPIGLYLLDRILRFVMVAWNNLRVSRASMIQMEGGVTKLRISTRTIKSWRPGSHVLLSIPKFGLMQSHPATILSTPDSHDGDLVFLLKGHGGFTKKIYHGANTSSEALISEKKDNSDIERNAQIANATHVAVIDGPYGGTQSDLAAFDSALLLSGSTGITFNLSILQHLAERVTTQGRRLPIRRVHLVWCVKSSSSARWLNKEIATAYEKLHAQGINVQISIYVTCADQFTDQSTSLAPKECGCECDKSKGPCCCVIVDEEEEGEQVVKEDKITPTKPIPKAETKLSSPSLEQLLPDQTPLGIRLPFLSCATFYSGRPDVDRLISILLDGACGESAISVCGPLGLTSTVRNTLVRQSDARAIHKGTGAQGCYLHVESFS
ncbi:Ferric/cupric reductase transmembrane component 7 [Cercospora beticola]|uniref:ferric-chelate reductase (NADPH) n=1 Tax=Cercospora beticola TaxID=122368 RepID=A0A2G5IE64_CERBT|nr:Ferric/cupric reductase transmembrane component 7 [Cercospora beticola]PIB03147.1 Ferric/cupric reductase transmembrane component 7 [Cercospora beticola]WPB04482.1 hypothetical protein RHO25_009128 [Cercospora beticola]CAK1356680.1 unnamed protein product [Cercospora beticola]